MAITKSQWVERILIVKNEDGTLRGAHQEQIIVIRDGDQVLSAQQLPAETVSAEALDGLVDASTLVAQVDSLIDQLRIVSEERDNAVSQTTALQSQIATLEARIAELLNPWGPRKLAPYDFLSLLTGEEIYAMQTSVDPVVIVGRSKLQTIITYVDLDNVETQSLVRYMESAGLLEAGRAETILSGISPQ